jgi:hypothetical protein
MCLQAVTAKLEPTTLIQSGWKKFAGTSKQPRFEVFGNAGSMEVPLDKWLKAETETKIIGDSGNSYEAGFHIYEDEQELTRNNFRRVYYRNAHTRGREKFTIVIAREIFVPSDPDAWPPRG